MKLRRSSMAGRGAYRAMLAAGRSSPPRAKEREPGPLLSHAPVAANEVSALEMREFPEFFGGQSIYTPDLYLLIRNNILKRWKNAQPTHITVEEASGSLDLQHHEDIHPAVRRIHEYLVRMGTINTGDGASMPETMVPPPREKKKRRRHPTESVEPVDEAATNNEYCEMCGGGAYMLCCDGCPASFHFECLGIKPENAPAGNWYCSNCSLEQTQQPRVTSLQEAARKGDVHKVVTLLGQGVDVDSVLEKNMWTPLHYTSRQGDVTVAQTLAEWGAHVNAVTLLGQTPVHIAAAFGNVDVVRMLIADRKAALDAPDKNVHWTPLHYASKMGRVDVVRALLGYGANVMAVDVWKTTALHIGCFNGHDDVATMLLESGADVNALDEENRTPLHYAAEAGVFDTVQTLLAHGADIHLRDSAGVLPIDMARTQEIRHALQFESPSSLHLPDPPEDVCPNCNLPPKATAHPRWRRGPPGMTVLCNACGQIYAKRGLAGLISRNTKLAKKAKKSAERMFHTAMAALKQHQEAEVTMDEELGQLKNAADAVSGEADRALKSALAEQKTITDEICTLRAKLRALEGRAAPLKHECEKKVSEATEKVHACLEERRRIRNARKREEERVAKLSSELQGLRTELESWRTRVTSHGLRNISVEDVVTLLDVIGLGSHAEAFQAHTVTGAHLMAAIDNDNLLREWGMICLGDRLRLQCHVRRMEKGIMPTARCREDAKPTSWSVMDVEQWLQENGWGHHVDAFCRETITGESLMSLQEKHLEALGVVSEEERAAMQLQLKAFQETKKRHAATDALDILVNVAARIDPAASVEEHGRDDQFATLQQQCYALAQENERLRERLQSTDH